MSEIQIELFDKTFTRVGFINAPQSLEATHRLNAASTATIVIPASSPKSWLLMGEGHRVRIVARGIVWSGWLDRWELDGIGPDATLTAKFASDLTWLEQVVCWPITGTLPGTLSREYDRRTGPAETVLKGYLKTACVRLGLPIDMAPDQGRGSVITKQLRMHTPADKLLPDMEPAGLRVTLTHNAGSRLTLDVAAIRTYPRTITATSSVLGYDTRISVEGPTASRVVVGGAGEKTARLFRSTTWDAVEAAWGRVAEKFIDGRQAQIDAADPLMDTQAEVDAVMDDDADKALDEGNARVSVAATLSETAWFRVGAGVLEVGDRIPLVISIPTADPAHPVDLSLTETITEAVVSYDQAGLTVAPKLGRMVDDPQGPLLTRVAALSARQRNAATI